MKDPITVVVPVYNEAETLAQNVSLLEGYLKTLSFDYEVILVNDGSRDSSEGVCRELAAAGTRVRSIGYRENRGKGYAVKTGILAGSGKYRLFMDADLAVPVQFVAGCLSRLEAGADAVIGSRHLPGAYLKVREGSVREFMGSVYRKMVRMVLGLKVSDVTCGLKGFRSDAAVQIFSRSKIDRWGYDAEILFLAQRLGYEISEIPVEWSHSFDSKVTVGLDSVRSFLEMLQILIFHRRGRYRLG